MSSGASSNPASSTLALSTLREANNKIRAALDHFRPKSSCVAAVTADDFSLLLAELLRAAECLRNLAMQNSAVSATGADEKTALDQEKRDYRHNLEQLRRVLPDVHARLLAEKARLQNRQTHAAAATAWAQASGKIL
jgi:hypothetical protein